MKKITLIAVIMVVMIFGAVAYSFADVASGSVAVSATVGQKIEITVPATLDLGTILPDASNNGPVAVQVRSNKGYTITRVIVDDPLGGMAVTGIAIPNPFGKTPGNGNLATWTDTLTGAVNWNATAGDTRTSNVTYTATQ